MAVDGQAGTLWWGRASTMKAVDLWPLVAGLREMDVLDALAWVGAPSHRDADVRAVGLPPVELPPYSPELNPAERLFEEIRILRREHSVQLLAAAAMLSAAHGREAEFSP